MKNAFLILFLILLVSCSVRPPLEQPAEERAVVNETPVREPEPAKLYDDTSATRTVKQESSSGVANYGLTENNVLVYVKKNGENWNYKYENGLLSEIDGPESFEFLYRQGLLDSIDFGARKIFFKYDNRNRLIKIEGLQYPVYIDYDSKDRVIAVRRGVSGKTSIAYDSRNRIESISRGPKIMNVYYDEKNRTRGFDGDDTHFILGYWKDGKLISLTGRTFGTGLTVSYGPDLPPTEALIVHAEDDSRFTASYTNTVYKVADLYLYCKYIRRLKSIPFEGQSFAFFMDYFDGSVADYFKMNYVCRAIE